MKKENKPIWFKGKQYGWGWYPATIEGWLLTVGYLVIVLWLSISFTEKIKLGGYYDATFIPVILLLTIVFIGICYATGEKPEWRWAGKAIFKKK